VLYPLNSTQASPQAVAVTGAGIATALGIGWNVNARGFRQGTSALRPVRHFDVSRQRARIAGEVDLPADWHHELSLPARRLARWDRALAMLWLAGSEAWQQATWEKPASVPLVLGTTSAGMLRGQEFYQTALSTEASRRHQPSRVIHYQAQRQAAEAASQLRTSGPVTIISNACASGTNAIGHAWQLVRSGQYPRVLAGGYEALCLLVFAGFDSLQAMSPNGCRPFDTDRDGLNLGEGAALLALETLGSARARGAPILGVVESYASSTDIHHLTQPHPEGEAARTAMTKACELAGISPRDIDYLNAHGTGTRLNDSAEAQAIVDWAGPHVSGLPVSSTKRSVGHLLGAAGAVEAVLCLMTLQGQWLPPMPELKHPDPRCDFPLVRQPRDASLERVMSNSFGFGGANATLIFKRSP
jgi:3-oxoacyl-[acyl-carrier-protein] synthase II